MFFRRPKLIANTVAAIQDGGVNVSAPTHSVLITPTQNKDLVSLHIAILKLDGEGVGIQELCSPQSEFTTGEILKLLEVLDKACFLIEGDDVKTGAQHGRCVITRLEQQYFSWRRQKGNPPFMTSLMNGTASMGLLAGHATEYYHITARAYDAILPFVNQTQGRHQQRAVDFVLDEYRHDVIMIKAVRAFGFSDTEVAASLPLPYTIGIMNLLGYWARTDTLTFMASLFMMEGDDDSDAAYHKALALYDLPDGYRECHAEHDKINSEGEHGDISRNFFSDIDYVSPEDEERIQARLKMLFETMWNRNKSLIDYYMPISQAKLRTAEDSYSHSVTPACSKATIR